MNIKEKKKLEDGGQGICTYHSIKNIVFFSYPFALRSFLPSRPSLRSTEKKTNKKNYDGKIKILELLISSIWCFCTFDNSQYSKVSQFLELRITLLFRLWQVVFARRPRTICSTKLLFVL